MITKKLPLIAPFPDFPMVKELSRKYITLSEYKPVFYDIETTGLSAAKSYCYLIGCISFEEDRWFLRQWLAEKEEEEPAILAAFAAFIRKFTYTIQYNGNKFDVPFLLKRSQLHNLEMPIAELPALDLFQELKVCKKLLKFQQMKQPDLEYFLGAKQRVFADGKQCIKCYKEYLKHGDSGPLQEVLGHNTEDLCGLGQIFLMLSYVLLFKKDYRITKCIWNEPNLILHFALPLPVPADFSCASEQIYLTGSGCDMQLLTTAVHEKVKMYYSNYKDYAYLPAEDTAIPKSLSSYIDKSLKEPARPETCYTWFRINERFLNDNEQLLKYLHHLLDFFLYH